MSYLDTNRLRHLVADGQTLAKETVLDLLTRVERQQDNELRQLALDKYPIEPPPVRPAKDQVQAISQHLLENGEWLTNNPILDYIQQTAKDLQQLALRERLTYDPTSLQLQIHPETDGHLVRLTATATYREQS